MKKYLSIIWVIAMLFSLTACGGGTAKKNSAVNNLTDYYWYMNTGNVYYSDSEPNIIGSMYIKFDFDSNGTFSCTMVRKEIENSESLSGIWKYDQNSKKLTVFSEVFSEEVGENGLVFSYDDSANRFEIVTIDGEDASINEFEWILFPCNKSFDTLDEDTYVFLRTAECGPGDYRTEYGNISDPLELTNLLKDKNKIDELRHTIIKALIDFYEDGGDDEDIKYIHIQHPVQIDPKEGIVISKLFDTSNENGKKYVELIEEWIGEKLVLYSKLKNGGTIQIYFDPLYEECVIQIISKSNDIQFYIDNSGEHNGIYKD